MELEIKGVMFKAPMWILATPPDVEPVNNMRIEIKGHRYTPVFESAAEAAAYGRFMGADSALVPRMLYNGQDNGT